MRRKIGISLFTIIIIVFISILCSCAANVKEVSLTINYNNVAKEVPFGTELSLSGLEVKSRLSDGTYRTVPRGGDKGYSVDTGGYDREEAGEYTIIISYKNFEEAKFTIVVLEEEIIDESKQTDVTVVGIAIRKYEGKRIFNLGEPFSTEDIIVEKVFSDDSRETIDTPQLEIDSSEYEGDKQGVYTIIIKYYGNYNLFDTYTVTVIKPVEPKLIDIVIKPENSKTEYLYGEEFSANGLIVEKRYENNDGALEPVVAEPNELIIDDSSFYWLTGVNAIGFHTIKVRIKDTDIESSYKVEIIDYIDSISLYLKVNYNIGEEFQKEQVQVFIHTAAGGGWQDEDLNNYIIDDSNFNSQEAGTYEIIVTMKENPDIFVIAQVNVI